MSGNEFPQSYCEEFGVFVRVDRFEVAHSMLEESLSSFIFDDARVDLNQIGQKLEYMKKIEVQSVLSCIFQCLHDFLLEFVVVPERNIELVDPHQQSFFFKIVFLDEFVELEEELCALAHLRIIISWGLSLRI